MPEATDRAVPPPEQAGFAEAEVIVMLSERLRMATEPVVLTPEMITVLESALNDAAITAVTDASALDVVAAGLAGDGGEDGAIAPVVPGQGNGGVVYLQSGGSLEPPGTVDATLEGDWLFELRTADDDRTKLAIPAELVRVDASCTVSCDYEDLLSPWRILNVGGDSYDFGWFVFTGDCVDNETGNVIAGGIYRDEDVSVRGDVTSIEDSVLDATVAELIEGYAWFDAAAEAGAGSYDGECPATFSGGLDWIGRRNGLGECSIEVGSTPILSGGLLTVHTYLIIKDQAGRRVGIRGGPEELTNNIVIQMRAHNTNFPDFWPGSPRVTISSGEGACEGVRCLYSNFATLASVMVDKPVSYWPLGPNSNSVVGELLRSCGLPVHSATAAPGIDTSLYDD